MKEFQSPVLSQPEELDNKPDWSDHFSDESRNEQFKQQIPTVIYDDIERSTSNQPSDPEMYSKENVKYQSKPFQPQNASWKQAKVYRLLDNGVYQYTILFRSNNCYQCFNQF